MTRWLLPLLVACGGPVQELESEQVTVACGMCIYKQPSERGGCYWALERPDGVVPILGGNVLPVDHENHAPDGMCNTKRQAVVSGKVYEDKFVATAFELLPADVVPEAPAYTPEDIH